jgi:hypothetical protein
MVNIWKIGAWPGYPGRRISTSNKKKFIKEALRKNYVAIGWKRCTAENKTEKEIRKKCEECDECSPKIGRAHV